MFKIMRIKQHLFVSLATLTLLLGSCALAPSYVRGSGNVIGRDYSLSDFDAVEIHGAFNVTLSQATASRVHITLDDNLFEHLSVAKSGRTLVIQFVQRPFSAYQATQAQAEISLPNLTALKASGASQITLPGFKTNGTVTVELSGASRLNGALDAGVLRLDASGSSQSQLRGTIPALDLSASGASNLDLKDVLAESAKVRLSGSSDLSVNAAKALNYDISGASTLRYRGQPVIDEQQNSGSSNVKPLP